MKRKLLAIALVLFSGSVLLASAQTSPHKTQTKGPRPIISEYGTLLDIVDAYGKSRFGKLEGDGFRVRYKVKGQKARVASAVGSTQFKGLLAGKVKSEDSVARVIVTTEDRRLEIASEFYVDEAGKTLIIRRWIKNTSCEKLWLAPTVYYVALGLFGPSGGGRVDMKTVVMPRIEGWGLDICPVGTCDSGSNCVSNVCPTLYRHGAEGDSVTYEGEDEVLAECPCGPPDKKPANATAASIKIVISKSQLR